MQLVVHIVYWLCQRHDPNAEIPTDVFTERHRIAFLKAVAEILQVEMHIKLNLKWPTHVKCVRGGEAAFLAQSFWDPNDEHPSGCVAGAGDAPRVLSS